MTHGPADAGASRFPLPAGHPCCKAVRSCTLPTATEGNGEDSGETPQVKSMWIFMLHGAGIFTYIWDIHGVNVAKYY